MQKQTYQWRLFDDTINSIERYCNHCGKKVVFRDSCKRRHNANGKTLHEYAIYKCEKDHTWNKMIKTYKATEFTENITSEETFEMKVDMQTLDLLHHVKMGMDEIEIVLEDVTGKWRLDKLLSDRIQDISRTIVCKMIEAGEIRVDGRIVKQNLSLKKLQVITISFKNMPSFLTI